jgi:4-carboxymuconolactone decarboxylase
MTDDRHERGMARMSEVYAWDDVPDLKSEFFRVTADHLFGEIWNREGLSIRDRRLLLLGVVAALGEWTVLPVQVDAILSRGEMTPDELREAVIFLSHYVGWPRGSAFNTIVEQRVSAHPGRGAAQDFPGPARNGS